MAIEQDFTEGIEPPNLLHQLYLLPDSNSLPGILDIPDFDKSFIFGDTLIIDQLLQTGGVATVASPRFQSYPRVQTIGNNVETISLSGVHRPLNSLIADPLRRLKVWRDHRVKIKLLDPSNFELYRDGFFYQITRIQETKSRPFSNIFQKVSWSVVLTYIGVN